jgi:hypothetical protein
VERADSAGFARRQRHRISGFQGAVQEIRIFCQSAQRKAIGETGGNGKCAKRVSLNRFYRIQSHLVESSFRYKDSKAL